MTHLEHRLQTLQEIKAHVELLIAHLEKSIRDNDSRAEDGNLYPLEDVIGFCLQKAAGSHMPPAIVEWIASSALGAIDAYPDPDEKGGEQ